jgi:hypothetical protein
MAMRQIGCARLVGIPADHKAIFATPAFANANSPEGEALAAKVSFLSAFEPWYQKYMAGGAHESA